MAQNPTFQKANLGLPNANTPFIVGQTPSQITQAWMMFFLQLNTAIAGNGAALEGSIQGVDNIADLRAQTSVSFTAQVAYVEGYYTQSDGGEGIFVQSDKTDSDNGGTIIVDASGRRWLRQTGGGPYNILWWGAQSTPGEQTFDNTPMVQAALDWCQAIGGGQVTVPVGIYYTTGVLTVHPGCSLEGVAVWTGANYYDPTVTVRHPCFLVTNGGAPFITLVGAVQGATDVTGGAGVRNLAFFYPNQVTWAAAAPIAYPPTIYMYKTSFAEGCMGINPYQFISLNGGRSRVLDCQAGAIYNFMTIDSVYDYIFIDNCELSQSYEYWPLGANYGAEPLDEWCLNNRIGWIVYRADAFSMSNINSGFAAVGFRFADSPITQPAPYQNAYGVLTNVDIDTVGTCGVQVQSANSVGGGIRFSQLNIGQGANVFGVVSPAAIMTVAGGSDIPLLLWDGGAMRGWTGTVGVIQAVAACVTARNIQGLTPFGNLGALTPAFPSSTFVQENFRPFPIQVFMETSGGVGVGVTHVKLNGVGIGANMVTFILNVGDTIEIDYSGVTGGWTWWGL